MEGEQRPYSPIKGAGLEWYALPHVSQHQVSIRLALHSHVCVTDTHRYMFVHAHQSHRTNVCHSP